MLRFGALQLLYDLLGLMPSVCSQKFLRSLRILALLCQRGNLLLCLEALHRGNKHLETVFFLFGMVRSQGCSILQTVNDVELLLLWISIVSCGSLWIPMFLLISVDSY